MSHFEFNPFGTQSIILGWTCMHCNNYIELDEIFIPQPNYMADSSRDSQTEIDEEIDCNNCGNSYNIYLYSSLGGGNGLIPELPEDYEINVVEVEELYDEEQYEAITNNSEFFVTFMDEIKNLRDLNEYNLEISDSIDLTLRRQIYVGVIATMETYLSDAFIITTLESPEYKEKFVRTFKDFKDRSFSLTDLFDYYKDIDNICKKALLDLIYHNLPKIKGIYRDTLAVDLGDIAEASKAVQIRHNLVHRNGKNKEGQHFIITKEIISNLIDEIEKFVLNIDQQIKDK